MSKTDLEIVLDYILDYGGLGYLPNMGDKEEGGSGDFAYEAALRLKEDMEMVKKMRIDARAKCQAAHSEETANA
tara:strand:- start:398 stop:619 length:222 start_codon:yes stop_codon:yes gene_type:complete